MKKITKERIYPTKAELEDALHAMRLADHIRRYQLIKRYCYGVVLDAACGAGYGSHLLANNPDIEAVIGADASEEAISYAKGEFGGGKVSFTVWPIEEIDVPCDTLVSMETIEHLHDLGQFAGMVERCRPCVLAVSFPDKKSTHFNEHHHHDLKRQDVVNLLGGYCCVREISGNDVTILVFVRLDSKTPAHIFR